VSALFTEELLEKIFLGFLSLYISERTTVRHYAKSVGTLPNKGNNNGIVLQGAFKRESPQKQTKPRTKKKTNSNITGRIVSALLTEELLEKIMLPKTKHKKLWKFY
jgi:hypothetical protein